MTSQQKWYWALDYCMVAKFVSRVAFPSMWRMSSKYSTLLHSCLLNKWGKFITEMSCFLCWGIFWLTVYMWYTTSSTDYTCLLLLTL